jgi:hypothetical protein
MNLPDYFLADLPAEAALNPTIISEACRTLRRNRERYLVGRSTQSLISLLSDIARDWLSPDFPFRKAALERGPSATYFSQATIASGLDLFFRQLTRENLLALVIQDLGHPSRLDELCASEAEQQTARMGIATAPQLIAHITAGNLPTPALLSIVLGVLSHSAQFVKCASGASFLPRLFAHSLYQADAKLGACLEIAEWRGGNDALEQALFDEAECVTATGSDAAISSIRKRLPPSTRLAAYGNRVSFAFVSSEVLSSANRRNVMSAAAADVAAWNQLGCLSPHVIYVENGTVSGEQFAELLAEELARREQSEPRGELPVEISAAIASRRSIYEIRSAYSDPTTATTGLWISKDSTAWTVVYEADPRFQVSCLHRFIYVKPVKDLTEALKNADSVREKVSTVGLAAPQDKAAALATELARWGATRVCPLGQMQNPPLTWRHDGRPPLGELVRWTDWEPA